VSRERHERHLERWAKSGKVDTAPIPAATVVLIRDGGEGLETLMLRKSSKIAFGGMWVFPGGRVDETDRDALLIAHSEHPLDEDQSHAAAQQAAVREAREETGLEISREDLVTYSHWVPPPIAPRRFLTWFFLAPAPTGKIVIDQGEIRDHAWMRPVEALQRRDALEIELAPPTFVTLHELCSWPTVERALEAVAARPAERFQTRVSVGDAGPVAMWHGDAAWPEGDVMAPGPRHRLWMRDDGWLYERVG
jgi:8-oxo-dGTP pyrophosphatase MutT (NUDIX family)